MKLFRVHAYAVIPRRTSKAKSAVAGGALRVDRQLRQLIEKQFRLGNLGSRDIVNFDFPDGSRSCEVRDCVMQFGFGATPTVSRSALTLADRLANAMDERSDPCLFVPTALRNGDRRTIALWTFPKDEALRLSLNKHNAALEILKDVFSQSSHLRKAAAFDGRQLDSEFLEGHVLDFQSTSKHENVAAFWIERFLQCLPAITSESGTRMLGDMLRIAFDRCTVPADREQLVTAALAMRRSPQKRITVSKFAGRYLSGNASNQFLRATPRPDCLNASFTLDEKQFERDLNLEIFELEAGVFVSSPLQEIGQSVLISGRNQDRLEVKGTIKKRKLRRRHG